MPGSDSPQQDPGGLEITRGERARKGWGVGSGLSVATIGVFRGKTGGTMGTHCATWTSWCADRLARTTSIAAPRVRGRELLVAGQNISPAPPG